MKNLKRNMVIAAMGIVVAGGGFFAGSYFSRPVTAAQSVNMQTSQSQQEIEALPTEVKTLRQESSASNSSAAPEKSTAMNPPAVMQISEQALPAASTPSHIAQSSAPSSVAPAKLTKTENAGTVFEGYTVTVTDKKTPAEMALGRDWPITKLYFLDSNGDSLGSISGTAYNAIIDKYKTPDTWDAPGANGAWEFWFAEEFNSYRGLSGNGSTSLGDSQSKKSAKANDNFDASSLASIAFDLVNAERASAGLGEVEMDSDMMGLAAMRAEELAEKYDHVRPNGTRMSVEYKYAEINNRRANTAEIAVSSWMGSSGHKDIILTGRYNYAGIGCYQSGDGTVYWCMLFSK